jgi:hypothetical protein
MSIAIERRQVEHRKRMAGAVVIAVLSLADVITSAWLQRMGGTEVNPVGRWLIDHGLLAGTKVAAVLVVVLLLRRARPAPWVVPGVWFVAGLYAAIIGLHLLQLASA